MFALFPLKKTNKTTTKRIKQNKGIKKTKTKTNKQANTNKTNKHK